jgi:hypothetical protein
MAHGFLFSRCMAGSTALPSHLIPPKHVAETASPIMNQIILICLNLLPFILCELGAPPGSAASPRRPWVCSRDLCHLMTKRANPFPDSSPSCTSRCARLPSQHHEEDSFKYQPQLIKISCDSNICCTCICHLPSCHLPIHRNLD